MLGRNQKTPGKAPLSKLSLSIPVFSFQKSRTFLSKLKQRQEKISKKNISENSSPDSKSHRFSNRSSKNLTSTKDSNFSRVPAEEDILNVVRIQIPKAEIRDSPLIHSARHFSPSKFCIEEQSDELKSDLKNQRAKYRKLEALYNEMLHKNQRVEQFYRGVAESITGKIAKCSLGEKQKKAREVLMEVIDIKEALKGIVHRIEGVTQKIKEIN
jgi:hypothetical protein